MARILVIEDDHAVRSNLLEILDAEGFSVMGAENGRVGVQLAHDYLPDLVICDIMMPGLDGYGVLTELRQGPTTAAIPFIFLTARGAKSDLRQGMELGADDYLVKPFTLEEVLRAVSVRLEKRAQVGTLYQQKLDELRNNIAASLPHEFLTPLTVILAASDILVRHPENLEPGEVPVIGERIQSSAQRLHRLIKNFLLYTRLELAATDPAKAEALRGYSLCDARTVIGEAALRVAEQAGRAMDSRMDVVDATLALSAANLAKIVEELLDNAFKFSQSGSEVSVSGYVDAPHVFTLSVKDNGRGMTPEQIARVGAYAQFDREQYEQQGQGLGLAIVKRLAELHGGELSIQSVPGRQTTVHVALPIRNV
jgi:two-component system sensor histidine kinase/response regulator